MLSPCLRPDPGPHPGAQQQPANAIAAVTHPDPYPFYASLRRERPLYRDDALNLWVASSHAVVDAALQHPGLMVRPPAETVPHALVGTAAGDVFAQLVRMNEGDFHARHKPPVIEAARQIRLQQVAETSRSITAELLPGMDANVFMTALPIRVMATMLGVPADQLDGVTANVLDFVRGIASGASSDAVKQASDAVHFLAGLWGGQISPAVIANRIGFMQQSVDATAGLLGNTVCLLQHRPELIDILMQSEADARQLVAEVMRWDAPVQNTRRWAVEDLVLQGQPIAPGECLLLVLASANRDEGLNPDPDLFLWERRERKSFTFGAGVHACPGESIAIEIVAACARQLCTVGRLHAFFGRKTGYQPLPNARIPVFAAASGFSS